MRAMTAAPLATATRGPRFEGSFRTSVTCGITANCPLPRWDLQHSRQLYGVNRQVKAPCNQVRESAAVPHFAVIIAAGLKTEEEQGQEA